MDDGAGGLVCGKDEHLGYLYVYRCGGGIECCIGDVVAREGRDAFIYVAGPPAVAVEASDGEVGLHESGLEVGDAQGSVGEVDAQPVGERFDGGFGGAIDVAVGVGGIAGHRADVDDMSLSAADHTGDDESCHSEQTANVGINHRVPVAEVAFVFLIQSEGQSGVVDEQVDVLPVSGECFNGLACGFAVAHIEAEGEDLCAVLPEFGSDSVQKMLFSSVEDETPAFAGETLGAGEPYAARSASDECSFHGSLFSGKFRERGSSRSRRLQRYAFYADCARGHRDVYRGVCQGGGKRINMPCRKETRQWHVSTGTNRSLQ